MLKIALLGYGKMGKEIEQICLQRNHEVVLKIGKDNLADLTINNLKKADVAIEFSTPDTAFTNIQLCFDANIPVVVGTTGWLDKLDYCVEQCKTKQKGLFYASNFSVGVNIFFEINKKLAKLMANYPDYSVVMEEIHHTQKLDAPSGTAITLAEGIIEAYPQKKWVNQTSNLSSELPIISKREGLVPGTHNITYSSPIDEIFIQHTAHNRKGFAMGSVLAAEFMVGKNGYFGMSDLMGL
jgi:4-hydroxy-tetrahydrodipicolinate reductase